MHRTKVRVGQRHSFLVHVAAGFESPRRYGGERECRGKRSCLIYICRVSQTRAPFPEAPGVSNASLPISRIFKSKFRNNISTILNVLVILAILTTLSILIANYPNYSNC